MSIVWICCENLIVRKVRCQHTNALKVWIISFTTWMKENFDAWEKFTNIFDTGKQHRILLKSIAEIFITMYHINLAIIPYEKKLSELMF